MVKQSKEQIDRCSHRYLQIYICIWLALDTCNISSSKGASTKAKLSLPARAASKGGFFANNTIRNNGKGKFMYDLQRPAMNDSENPQQQKTPPPKTAKPHPTQHGPEKRKKADRDTDEEKPQTQQASEVSTV